jgi:pimeloyl-ACP methyl ester carboxylesterase/DNA-binding winged helix-turn-helix (wHTH) protein
MAKYAFDSYVVDVDERRLLRNREEMRIRGKVFDTLCVLVKNAGRLVRKDELMQAVWPDAVVEENNLDYCISHLRKLLQPGQYIETVPRHGYRFVGTVLTQEPIGTLVSISPAQEPVDCPEPEVQFFTTSDGVRIAYSIGGQGPVLVRTIDWLNHLNFEWKSPYLRHWLSEIMRHNTLVRYDQRGSGLSDWEVNDFSFGRMARDFEELIEEIGLDRFSIFGGCQGASIATVYAMRHPECVTKLIFNGAFANGWPPPIDGAMEQFEALLTLVRLGWGNDNPAFRQLWSTLFRPDADSVEMDWLNELQRISTTPENAVRMMSEFPTYKIFDLLPKITCPTLVLHSRDDATVPVQEGRLIASRIRDSRFVELPSRAHMVAPGDPAWEQFVGEFSTFLEWERQMHDSSAQQHFPPEHLAGVAHHAARKSRD